MTEVVNLLPQASDSDLRRLVGERREVVAHFWAPWNAWDQVPADELLAASRRLTNVRFVALCTDLHSEVEKEIRLCSIPGVAFWRSGQLVEFWQPGDVLAGMYREVLFSWFSRRYGASRATGDALFRFRRRFSPAAADFRRLRLKRNASAA